MKSAKYFIQRVALLGLCLLAFTVSIQAQVLDLESTTEGMLTPRMTTAQKDAIPTPDQGLLVYDTETMSFWYYDDMRWNEFTTESTSMTSGGSATPASPILNLMTTIDTITILDTGLIDSFISVCIDLTYPGITFLDISLTSPSGTTIDLLSRNGAVGENLTNTCFGSDARNPNITSTTIHDEPFTGYYQPQASYSPLNGEQIAGHWVLKVYADFLTSWTGTLNSWSIDLGSGNSISAGSLSDRDQDTKVTVEDFLDEDIIRLISGGHEVMYLASDAVTISPNGTNVLDIDEDAVTIAPNGTNMMEVDADGTFLGRWQSGYPGTSSQLTLSGAFNVGANLGLNDPMNPTNGTVKLRIEGYNNDGPVVYPIYVEDENNQVDFFIRNRLSATGHSQLYFQGNMGIGTTTPATRFSISPTTTEAKITLWDGGDTANHYGFGISSSQLNYHIPSAVTRHVFYAGGKNGGGSNISELMRIQGNGRVGIGTKNPDARLDVWTSNSTGNPVHAFKAKVFTFGSTPTSSSVGSADAIVAEASFRCVSAVLQSDEDNILNGNRYGVVASNGIVGIPGVTTGSHYAGLFYANGYRRGSNYSLYAEEGAAVADGGNWAAYINGAGFITSSWTISDMKVKKNIADLDAAIAKVKLLKPKTYVYDRAEYENMNLPEGDQMGFLAQDLEVVFPSLTRKGESPEVTTEQATNSDRKPSPAVKFTAVNQQPLIALLTKAIQEQQELIENLQTRIEALETE